MSWFFALAGVVFSCPGWMVLGLRAGALRLVLLDIAARGVRPCWTGLLSRFWPLPTVRLALTSFDMPTMVPAPDDDVTKELVVARERVLALERCRKSRISRLSNSLVRLLPDCSARSVSRDLLLVDLGLGPKAWEELAFLSCDALPTGDDPGRGLPLGVTGDSGILFN